ncbi:jg8175 [Pararge aegeria aegeria]|uniref:Jg8175 protein n=1 Tax=Pararge aegeria aegeria TaxID=348720 RepID=A0A8S4SN70_9NEOP|nr:jg8175 [Pararge aegeria aegeria]
MGVSDDALEGSFRGGKSVVVAGLNRAAVCQLPPGNPSFVAARPEGIVGTPETSGGSRFFCACQTKLDNDCHGQVAS